MITLGTLSAEALALAYQLRDHAMGAMPLPARRWRGEPVMPAFDLDTPEGIERVAFLRLVEGLGARRDWTWKRVRSERAALMGARSGYDLTSLAAALVGLAHLGLDIDPGAWAELVASASPAPSSICARLGPASTAGVPPSMWWIGLPRCRRHGALAQGSSCIGSRLARSAPLARRRRPSSGNLPSMPYGGRSAATTHGPRDDPVCVDPGCPRGGRDARRRAGRNGAAHRW
jgi:hypothetical protein